MLRDRALAALIGLALPLVAAQAQAADLKVVGSTAVKAVMEELAPQFEKATGNKVEFGFAPAAAIKKQIDEGATFDVAILTPPLNDALIKSGKLDGATITTVARAGLGVCVKKGAAKPDVSTPDALKATLLKASSIGYNAQGASRAGVEAMLAKLGIADAVKSKVKLLSTGAPVGVANGEVEFGLGPISEVLDNPNTEVVGAFPAEVQGYLVFAAGVSTASKSADAAKALIKFLATTPAAAPALKKAGMEPG
jgi:molybdate transport system substrate-binding protein